MASTQSIATVQSVYVAFYNRPADPKGLLYWADELDKNGGNLNAIIDSFANSPEAAQLYFPGSPAGSNLYTLINANNVEGVVRGMYNNLFSRPADEPGVQFYTNEFKAGRITAGSLVLDLFNGAQGDDKALVAKRITLANQFTEVVDGRPVTDPNFATGFSFNVTFSGDADAAAARALLSKITLTSTDAQDQITLFQDLKAQIADTSDRILRAPVITSNNGGDTATISFNETTSALQLTTVTATDTSGEVLRYALTGTNADLFNLDPITGVLSFKARPNVTADTNYAVTVTVTDSARNTDSQTLTIAVKNEVQSDQAPTITSNGGGDAASINYQKTSTAAVTTVTATDPTPNDQLTYSIEGGANAALFQIDAGTGTLTFKTPPSALTQDTSYVVVVKVADQFGGTDTQTLTINVQVQPSNVPPVITSNGGGGAAGISFVENGTGPVTTVTATDADVSDTGKLVYSLATSTDIDFFTIDASTGVLSFKKAPDFESATHAPEYAVAVKVTDLAGNSDTQLLTITVTDQANETITGGTGNESLPGGTGNDVINGGTGNETINGGAGNDAIDGGAGDDSIDGGLGNDTVVGGDGNDTVLGGDGDDGINGGAGDDSIDGGLGNDIVIGGDGNDTVLGGDGDDVVGGLGGNDVLNGGPGADSLVGGAGNDTITGGTGVDTFFFESTGTFNGVDQILDFQGGAGGDVMNFTAFLGTATVKYDAPLLTVTSGGGGLLGNLLGNITTTLTDADAAPQDDMDAALSQGGLLSTVGRGVTGLLGPITGEQLNTTVNDLVSDLTATNFANGTIATLKVLATETTDGSTVTEGFIGTQFGGTTGVFAVPEVGEKYVLLASVEADATNAATLPNGAPVHIFYVEYDATAANNAKVTLVGTANLGAGNDVDNFVAANFA